MFAVVCTRQSLLRPSFSRNFITSPDLTRTPLIHNSYHDMLHAIVWYLFKTHVFLWDQVTDVWELVGIDLSGPFPRTADGYQFILTATDYFSKWVEAFPLKTKSATEVGRHVCSLIYRHGCPKRILSDRGGEFVSDVRRLLNHCCFKYFFCCKACVLHLCHFLSLTTGCAVYWVLTGVC